MDFDIKMNEVICNWVIIKLRKLTIAFSLNSYDKFRKIILYVLWCVILWYLLIISYERIPGINDMKN